MSKFNVETNDLFRVYEQLGDNVRENQYYEDFDGRTILLGNSKLLHFANCNYLGLEKHPRLLEGAKQALEQYGIQNSMSRTMASCALYRDIEDSMRQIFPGHPLIYPTTTLAHYSALPILVGSKDAIILDVLVHNSVRMAAQLCQAKGAFVIHSKHNDMPYVGYLVKRLKREGYKNVWYCGDGIYSMHGDGCDVDGLYQLLSSEGNFFAYLDDAHGIGWDGKNGSGYVIGNYGLHEKLILVGSFAKSISAVGGFLIVSDKRTYDILRLTSPTLMFSGPIQPPLLGAISESLKLHLSPEIEAYQKALKDLIVYFKVKVTEFKIPILVESDTPIQIIRIGDTQKLLRIHKLMCKKGFFATTVGYPAIAKGDESIRISLTRHLTKADINDFLLNLKILLLKEKVNLSVSTTKTAIV